MKAKKNDEENKPQREYFLTKKGRPFMREEHFMQRLSEQERKAYEECMALVQGITENGGVEEACEWLEEYASEKDRKNGE